MRELEARTQVPRTKIHYYLRIGLLHPPQKAAVNSAIYDETHVERLSLIHRLRSAEDPSLPIFHVRRVLEMVDDGVPVEQAVALQLAVLGAGLAGAQEAVSARRMADRSGLSERRILDLERSGVLTRVPGSAEFDAEDLAMAEALGEFLDLGVEIAEIAEIARRIREISAFEMTIASRLTEGHSPGDRAQKLLGLQEAANTLHRYLFLRARQTEIQRQYTTAGGAS